MHLIPSLLFLEYSALIKSVDNFFTFKEFVFVCVCVYKKLWIYFQLPKLNYLPQCTRMLMLEGLKAVNSFSPLFSNMSLLSYFIECSLFQLFWDLFLFCLIYFLKIWFIFLERERAQARGMAGRGQKEEQGTWCGAPPRDPGIMTSAKADA